MGFRPTPITDHITAAQGAVAQIDELTADYRVFFFSGTPNPALGSTLEFMSQVVAAGGTLLATSAKLANVTVIAGVLNATDPVTTITGTLNFWVLGIYTGNLVTTRVRYVEAEKWTPTGNQPLNEVYNASAVTLQFSTAGIDTFDEAA